VQQIWQRCPRTPLKISHRPIAPTICLLLNSTSARKNLIMHVKKQEMRQLDINAATYTLVFIGVDANSKLPSCCCVWWLCASVMLVWWAGTLSGSHLGTEPPVNLRPITCNHPESTSNWKPVGDSRLLYVLTYICSTGRREPEKKKQTGLYEGTR